MTDGCTVCGAPTGDGAQLCRGCTRELGDTLLAVAFLAPDLDTALARQAKFGDHTPTRGRNHVLPYDERAAEAGAQLRGVLTGWIRVLQEAG